MHGHEKANRKARGRFVAESAGSSPARVQAIGEVGLDVAGVDPGASGQ